MMTTENENIQVVSVKGKYCTFQVHVQGDLNERHGKTVFLTVHDIGTNHNCFIHFVNHSAMESVKERAIFLHVCVPGQEDNAEDFTGEFPSLAQLGEDLVCVLDEVDVRTCIAFGEGAGANIVSRFALAWPNRIMAIILVNCTSTTAGFIEFFKDILMNLRLDSGFMTQGAWDYLMMHKFGATDKNEKREYIEDLKNSLNGRNLSKYLFSYSKRTDFTDIIGAKLENMDVLMVSGSRSPHLQSVYHMHKGMNKKKTTLLVVDGVCDIIQEAPGNLARSLILLCKGCGVLSGVPIPGMERQRTLSSSMEEADRPTRRYSVNHNTHHSVSMPTPVAE
jgi:protein NDRG1